jgi:glycosidase
MDSNGDEAECDNPASMLTLYNRLINVRRGESALEVGQFEPMEADGDLLTYVRRDRESAFLIALNLGPQPRVVNFSNKAFEGKDCALYSPGSRGRASAR